MDDLRVGQPHPPAARSIPGCGPRGSEFVLDVVEEVEVAEDPVVDDVVVVPLTVVTLVLEVDVLFADRTSIA